MLNQRECQIVQHSVYHLHFTRRRQTAYSFMLIAGHCARAVVVKTLDRRLSKIGTDGEAEVLREGCSVELYNLFATQKKLKYIRKLQKNKNVAPHGILWRFLEAHTKKDFECLSHCCKAQWRSEEILWSSAAETQHVRCCLQALSKCRPNLWGFRRLITFISQQHATVYFSL